MTEVDRKPSRLSLDALAFACEHLHWLRKDGQQEVKTVREILLRRHPPATADLLRICDRLDALVYELKAARRALWREGFEGRVLSISIGCGLGAVYAAWLILGLG